MRFVHVLTLPICASLAASFSPSLSASELWPVDLRVNLMLTPETEHVDASYGFTGGGGSSVESDTLDPGYRFEAGLVTRITEFTDSLSLVGGGWVFYGEQESDTANDLGIMTGPRSYLVFGIDLYMALRAEFNQYLSMEIGPVVGAGTTRFSDRMTSGGTTIEETGHGEYEEAAMNLQVLIRNTDRSVVVGLGLRYLWSYGEAENRYDSMVQSVAVEQRGLAPYLTVGMTF